MSSHNKGRTEEKITADEAISELEFIFPRAEVCGIQPFDPDLHFDDPPKHDPKSFLAWNETQGQVHAFIYKPGEIDPCRTISLRPIQRPHTQDLMFAAKYLRVFNKDIEIAPRILEHAEQWEALAASRASRAIARANKFGTASFLRCITVMEAASHLKYEGSDFRATVFLTQRCLSKPIGTTLVQLPTAIPFREALLNTKWLRAVAGEESIGLYSDLKRVYAIAALPGGPSVDPSGASPLVLPQGLRRVSVSIRPGMRALVCAKNGDLYVIAPNGLVFIKSQGRWHYLNYRHFQTVLANHLPAELAVPVLQFLLDLSFGRHGALICIPRSTTKLTTLVPDHDSPKKNRELRQAASNLNISNEAHRRILLAAAGVDGAVIISQDGKVLDVACMIESRNDDQLAAINVERQNFEGARSIAAWNASLEGIAIKVSEDGPISLFSNGQLVGQLG